MWIGLRPGGNPRITRVAGSFILSSQWIRECPGAWRRPALYGSLKPCRHHGTLRLVPEVGEPRVRYWEIGNIPEILSAEVVDPRRRVPPADPPGVGAHP